MSPKELIIIGPSDTFELAEAALGPSGASVIGYLSTQKNDHSLYKSYPYLGDDSVISSNKYPDAGYVLALADNHPRQAIFNSIAEAGNEVVTVVHPSAVLYPSAVLGRGVLMGPLAVVSAVATIGDSVYLNYGAHVGHDVIVGDFCMFGPGAKLFGRVEIGKNVVLGANVVVFPDLKIGDNAKISANTVVTRDVPPEVTLMSVQQNRTLRI